MNTIPVPVKRLPHGADLPLPGYATPGSAGLDLAAAISDDLVLEPGQRASIPTGLSIQIPEGYEGQIRPRSGLALRFGIALLNSPGTIDADYRGEIKALLVNLSSEPVVLHRGDRIAQLVIAPVTHVELFEVQSLDETIRGDGGFGHTGA